MDTMKTDLSYLDEAINIVAYVVNKAILQLGYQHNIDAMSVVYWQLKNCKPQLVQHKVQQLPLEAEEFIHDLVTKRWDVAKVFQYTLKAIDKEDCDQIAKYYYYEVIFSQPTPKYPIPQVTVSVFFRFEDKQKMYSSERVLPVITWRMEGQFIDHDVRFVKLTVSQLIMMMNIKRKFFKRLENFNMF